MAPFSAVGTAARALSERGRAGRWGKDRLDKYRAKLLGMRTVVNAARCA